MKNYLSLLLPIDRSHDLYEEVELDTLPAAVPVLRHSHHSLLTREGNLRLAHERRKVLYEEVGKNWKKEGKMKFSHSLVFNSVPEWTSYYLK